MSPENSTKQIITCVCPQFDGKVCGLGIKLDNTGPQPRPIRIGGCLSTLSFGDSCKIVVKVPIEYSIDRVEV